MPPLSSVITAHRQLWADLALLSVAAIWGATFVMVRDAVSTFPVFAFLAVRFVLATIALLPLAWREKADGWLNRRLIAQGGLMGLALFAGYGFQTMGLRYTTPAKAGFITGLSVVLVPAASALLLRRPPTRAAAIGIALATGGMALLSLNADLSIGLGDLLVLACAVSFAGQIVLTAAFAPGQPTLHLTCVQIAMVALTSGAIALAGERPWPPMSGQVFFAAVFTGVLATSFAFATQTAAQRFTSPTHTALIFSLEPVFAALFSFFLIGETLTGRAVAGCSLILAGMLTAELGDLIWQGLSPRRRIARMSREQPREM
ncbi:MAG: DMT family transporter [Anaerolineae bacterium]|nr:DMT family transporter [Anaerolineae bacterium]MDW8099672.1 DMT family transporter [Anaerolineae bacterium]